MRQPPCDTGGVNRFTTPLVASFILTGYDYAFDPIVTTVLGRASYRSPSGYFGVPLIRRRIPYESSDTLSGAEKARHVARLSPGPVTGQLRG